jgi:hypothetical protein
MVGYANDLATTNGHYRILKANSTPFWLNESATEVALSDEEVIDALWGTVAVGTVRVENIKGIPSGLGTLAVYDCVGLVKAFFTALGRKQCVRRRRCEEAGVKGAFFAFISTLDTGLPTSTIGLG